MGPDDSRADAKTASAAAGPSAVSWRRASWILQLSRLLPGSSPMQGAAATGVLLLFALASEWWTRGPLGLPPFDDYDRYMLVLFPLLIGYVVAIVPWGVRESLRDLDAMRPNLSSARLDDVELEHHLDRHPLRLLVAAIVVGVGTALLTQELVAQRLSRVFGGSVVAPRDVALMLLSIGFWVTVLSGFSVVIANALFFARLGSDLLRVNLLAMTAVMQPFARVGLRYVAMIAGLLGIVFFLAAIGSESMWIRDQPRWDRVGGFAISVGGTLLAALLSSGVALVLPSVGVHRTIRNEKARMLDEIDRRIGDHAELLAEPTRDAAPPQRVRETVELLTLRQQIDAVPEWPFDPVTRARFAGFTLIPAVSWMGPTVLERLVFGT